MVIMTTAKMCAYFVHTSTTKRVSVICGKEKKSWKCRESGTGDAWLMVDSTTLPSCGNAWKHNWEKNLIKDRYSI